jgi:hypothetical protein
MDAAVRTVPLTLAGASRSKPTWIESARFDLTFFGLSPVVVLPLVLLALVVDRRLGLFFFLLSFPHYMSTLSFFLWDEYQDRFRARWFAFYGGPVVIAATFFLLIYTGLPRIIQVVLFAWNIYHVGRQSCGILSVYRHGAGVTDPSHKGVTNFAILASNFFLAFWNVDSHDAFDPLRALRSDWSSWLRAGLGAVALVGLVRLGLALRERARAGQGVELPEALFLLTSLSLFHPFLWMPSSNAATAVMLLPHYVQYLGIVWLLNRRRFREADGSARQRILARVSRSTPLLVAVLLSIGAATIGASVFLRHSGHEMIFESFYLLVALEHFYLDGLFWAFRDPAVRRSFGPYLIGYDGPARPARAAA